MGGNGYLVDAAHADGLVVNERCDGGGWISSLTGRNVTQQDFNTTRPGADQGLSVDASLGAALGLWLLGAQLAPLLGLTGGATTTDTAPIARPFNLAQLGAEGV